MLLSNFILNLCRFAAGIAVNKYAPKKGQRISIPGKPDPYYLVENVNGDKGQWMANIRGKIQEITQNIASSNISGWSNYSGPLYDWDSGQEQANKQRMLMEKNKKLVEDFENKYKFPNGQVLKLVPGKELIVKFNDNVSGEEGILAGQEVVITSVNPETNKVNFMSKKEGDEKQLVEMLSPIDAGWLVANANPVSKSYLWVDEAVKIPELDAAGNPIFENIDGKKVQKMKEAKAGDLMALTPTLNRMAQEGKVRIEAQVYANYNTQKGGTGEDIFIKDMAARGLSPDVVQELTGYTINNTPKINAQGKPSLFGAWQGTVYIDPPMYPEVIDEVKNIARNSQIFGNEKTGLKIYSNLLFKQMISLGVTKSESAMA